VDAVVVSFVEGFYFSNRHGGADSNFLFSLHGVWISSSICSV